MGRLGYDSEFALYYSLEQKWANISRNGKLRTNTTFDTHGATGAATPPSFVPRRILLDVVAFPSLAADFVLLR